MEVTISMQCKTLGEFLVAKRMQNQKTVQEIAEELNISTMRIWKYEKNKIPENIMYFLKLLDRYRIKIGDLKEFVIFDKKGEKND